MIRALRLKPSSHPRSRAAQKLHQSALERSMIEKSSAWKLPPNVYVLKDHFKEVSMRQMGKLGPYRCFTVERDVRTVRNNLAPKPLGEVGEKFYELRPGMDDTMTLPRNQHKSKFLKAVRFDNAHLSCAPPPTKYFPQNFALKSQSSSSKSVDKQPLFYYPQTSVPVTEMKFNKASSTPAPGRYEPYEVTCKCYLTGLTGKCPANVCGDGHRHVFESRVFRLVAPVTIDKRRSKSAVDEFSTADDFPIIRRRPSREPLSFRKKRSHSWSELPPPKEVHFNTVIRKRNMFSVKTGRPVAFLSAMPRFKEDSEISIKIETQKSQTQIDESEKKPKRKPMTKQRLAELAKPKNPLPKIVSDKVNILEGLPPAASQKIVKKVVVNSDSSRMSDISVNEDDDVIGNERVISE